MTPNLGNEPPGPAPFLREKVMRRHGLTQEQLAKRLGVSRRTISQLLLGQRSLTAKFAVRIARLTNTTPNFWLNLQQELDVWRAKCEAQSELENITPLL